MEKLIKLAENCLKIDLLKVADKIHRDNESKIVNYNTWGQLHKGETVSGNKVQPKYRSKRYADQKAKQNSKPGSGTPDLRLTGKFYKNFVLEKGKDYFIGVKKTEDYFDELLAKYDDILGLQDENEQKYIEKYFTKPFLEGMKHGLQLS